MSELDILLKAVAVGLKAGLKAFAEGTETETVAEKAEEKPVKQMRKRKEAPAAAEEKTPAADETPVKKTRKKRGPKALKPGRKKGAVGRKRRGGVSDTDAVLEVIMAEENGIDQDELAEKSGFSKSKVHGIVYRLKKQGKIRSDRKGFYEKI